MSEFEPGTVQLAYLHTSRVSHSWALCMRSLREYDKANGGHLLDREMGIRTHPIRIVQSRNMVAKAFLETTSAEWLLWVDTDMGFPADGLARLLKVADPVERPIVGALCFSMMESAHDGLGGYRLDIVPTMYMLGRDVVRGHYTFSQYGPYPDDEIVRVAGTGSAFVLIHRTAFEKLRALHGPTWYDQVEDSEHDVIGEDLAFCLRATSAGIPIVVDTGTKTTHHKELWLGEEDYQTVLMAERAAEGMIPNPAPDLPLFNHLASSFAVLAKGEHEHDGMLKFRADLDRYRQIIEATQPDVIVETGTRTGASARWFAERGVDVVTVDVDMRAVVFAAGSDAADRVTCVVGDSADPVIAAHVAVLVAGRRCMVVLDSEHSAPHVRAEIEAYGPMVSAGCYLVVEDTIFGYGEDAKAAHGMGELEGSPLDAVLSHLVGHDEWSRDVAIEQLHPTGCAPAGWWVRNG